MHLIRCKISNYIYNELMDTFEAEMRFSPIEDGFLIIRTMHSILMLITSSSLLGCGSRTAHLHLKQVHVIPRSENKLSC